jgi:hypothetical protein
VRKQRAVDLGDSRSAVVRELRVRDMRLLLDRIQDMQGLAQTPLTVLVRERLPELLALAADSLTLPEGTVLDDLSLSECEAIKDAWWGLHQGFFGPLVAFARTQWATAVQGALSTARVSPALSAGITPFGTTAGPST